MKIPKKLTIVCREKSSLEEVSFTLSSWQLSRRFFALPLRGATMNAKRSLLFGTFIFNQELCILTSVYDYHNYLKVSE
jgi:hypothetical protein